jgi:hypothetical protein
MEQVGEQALSGIRTRSPRAVDVLAARARIGG